jgi:hypothetical protein
MPKVEYSKSKGLVQKSGSGFSIADVPVVEHVQTVTTAGATTISAHGTHLVTTGGAHNVTVSAGTYAGQKKLVVLSSDGGDMALLAETDGAGDDNDEAVGTATAVADYAYMMWIGDRWVTLSSVFT